MIKRVLVLVSTVLAVAGCSSVSTGDPDSDRACSTFSSQLDSLGGFDGASTMTPDDRFTIVVQTETRSRFANISAVKVAGARLIPAYNQPSEQWTAALHNMDAACKSAAINN